jgi:hypothetical protein
VVINWSARFQKPLPLLLNVPNFSGARIHSGNTDADTEGCVLVGRVRGRDFIGESRKAFAALFAKMKKAAASEKIWITINEGAGYVSTTQETPQPAGSSG